MSLSTATPSLGGALPKLATLKIGYEVARYHHNYDRYSASTEGVQLMSASIQSAKFNRFKSLRPRLSFSSNTVKEEDDESTDSVNVLATETEAGMSSSNFTIPRRATIDSDVSLLFQRSLSSFNLHYLLG